MIDCRVSCFADSTMNGSMFNVSDCQTSNNTNSSVANYGILPFHIIFKIFSSTIMVIIIIAAILGNLLVLYAFFNYHRLRGNVTNYYIASLAFSDLLTAVLVVPLELDNFIKDGIWTHGEIVCQFWSTLYLLCIPGSIINLSAVTLDRFIVLRVPLRYTELMTPKRAVVAIMLLWAYALITACLPVIGWRDARFPNYVNNFEGTNGIGCYFILSSGYVILINIANFIIPMFFMAICWALIYQIARKHQRRVKKLARSMSVNETTMSLTMNGVNGGTSISEGQHTKKSIKKHLKGSKYIAMIVGLFFLCWLPYSLLSLIVAICGEQCFIGTPKEVSHILLVMGYLNSALNPYLYPFHDRQFKEAFKSILFNVQNLQIWEVFCRRNSS